jgi:hypothetical protein
LCPHGTSPEGRKIENLILKIILSAKINIMDKSKIWMLEGAAIGVAVVLTIIFISRGVQPNSEKINTQDSVNTDSSSPKEIKYSAEVPKDATPTTAISEVSASDNPGVESKVKKFDLKATKNGFVPSSITVESGDEIQLNFSAVDSDTDLDLPYLGAYFRPVLKGESRVFPIGTGLVGTFIFSCRDFCPGGKKIEGSLIVISR